MDNILSKKARKVLRRIKLGEVKYLDLTATDGTKAILSELVSQGFIRIYSDLDMVRYCQILQPGIAHLEDRKREAVNVWWTRGLAIIAIFISIVALFNSCYDQCNN